VQVGTVNYMSPEAILDTGSGAEHPVTGRKVQCMKLGRQSDVWSLGCILYQVRLQPTSFTSPPPPLP
jgi:serine/threonine protein kinase